MEEQSSSESAGLRRPDPQGFSRLEAPNNDKEHQQFASELLLADADPASCDLCRSVALHWGLALRATANSEEVLAALESGLVDFLVLATDLPGADGLELLRHVHYWYPETQVIMVACAPNFPEAVQAIKFGAFDYLPKPLELESLRLTIGRAMEHAQIESAAKANFRDQVNATSGFGKLVGTSQVMQRLYKVILKVASNAHPVLILGESGTGKELVARAIHFSGSRRDCPFIPVDCGALVPTLVESELFGYEKGAFTGADRAKDGLLTIAEGGTVFLDEIGELPFDLQAKLLRALQEKEIRPVGSTRRISINVRIVAATNRDLETAVQQGKFRTDLYFRLNVVTLKVPPLRDRREDLDLLINTFLQRIEKATGKSYELTPEARRAMKAYDWPGNVRELENCLERATALATGEVLNVIDLPTQIGTHSIRSAYGSDRGTGTHRSGVPAMAEIEKHAILKAVSDANGDKLLAAKILGIGKTTLYRKLRQYQKQTAPAQSPK
ncbi:MAG TPA: sigma-54 dependent transcriptional regulator [Terriglobales bacterium]|nr:sigma-54 dependent transcriptional regulator [Terriglobales bacterium]